MLTPTLSKLNKHEIIVAVTEDQVEHATVRFMDETMLIIVKSLAKGQRDIIVCVRLEENGITLTHGYEGDPKPTHVELAH